MNEIEILKTGLTSMHNLLDKAVEEMTSEQWNYWPSQGGVSAFFSLWHYVRTEDNIIQSVIKKRNTIWLEHRYHLALNLHKTSQGTGMTHKEAQEIRISDTDLWLKYQRQVWSSTYNFLSDTDIKELHERTILFKPLPPISLWNGLFGVCLTHGLRHVGEIEHARGLVGLDGLTI